MCLARRGKARYQGSILCSHNEHRYIQLFFGLEYDTHVYWQLYPGFTYQLFCWSTQSVTHRIITLVKVLSHLHHCIFRTNTQPSLSNGYSIIVKTIFRSDVVSPHQVRDQCSNPCIHMDDPTRVASFQGFFDC
jgi:hypothetical protein